MNSLFECDLENQRLAEKGIVFVCSKSSCPLSLECPYAKRKGYTLEVDSAN